MNEINRERAAYLMSDLIQFITNMTPHPSMSSTWGDLIVDLNGNESEKPQQFFDAMMNKFHQKITEGRSATPWTNYDMRFLIDRFVDEVEEFTETIGDIPKHTQPARDELIDVANIAMFLWLHMQEMKS